MYKMHDLTLYSYKFKNLSFSTAILNFGLLKVETLPSCSAVWILSNLISVCIKKSLKCVLNCFLWNLTPLHGYNLFLIHSCLLPHLFYFLMLFPPPPRKLHWWKFKITKNLHTLCLQISSQMEFTSLIYCFPLCTSVVHFNGKCVSGLELQLWLTTLLLSEGPQHVTIGTRGFH